MQHIPQRYLTLGGWALLLGGLMGAIGQAFHAPDVPDSVADIPHFLSMAVNLHVLLAFSSTFVLLGLPALFLRQSAGLKWWGWLALPLLFIGLMFEIFHGPVQILAYPIMFDSVQTADQLKVLSDQINNLSIDKYPLQLLVLIPIVPFLLGGLLLMGISMLKARVLHRGPAILTLIVLFLLILGFIVKLPFSDHIFSLVHLIFIAYGALLAFENKPSLPNKISKDIATI